MTYMLSLCPMCYLLFYFNQTYREYTVDLHSQQYNRHDMSLSCDDISDWLAVSHAYSSGYIKSCSYSRTCYCGILGCNVQDKNMSSDIHELSNAWTTCYWYCMFHLTYPVCIMLNCTDIFLKWPWLVFASLQSI